MQLPWSDFYDNFVTLSTAESAPHTETAVGALFTLLGWEFARVGAKVLPFGSEFPALGISIKLGGIAEGFAEFSNT